MAKHNARSLRRSATIGAVLTACAALLFALVGVGPAGAVVSAGQHVNPKNTVVKGKCAVTFVEVNPSDGSVIIRLAGQAQPTKLAGYGTNAYTQVFCSVYDNALNLVAQFNPYADGPYLGSTAARFSIPFASSYHLCGTAFVKLNNGNNSLTPTLCT